MTASSKTYIALMKIINYHEANIIYSHPDLVGTKRSKYGNDKPIFAHIPWATPTFAASFSVSASGARKFLGIDVKFPLGGTISDFQVMYRHQLYHEGTITKGEYDHLNEFASGLITKEELDEKPAPKPDEEDPISKALDEYLTKKSEPAPAPESPAPAKPAFTDGWVGDVYMSALEQKVFESAWTIAQDNHPTNLLLVGPSGYGKTSLPAAYAKAKSMKYLRVNCASVRDPEEWFGYREAVGGSTVFVPTQFTQAVRDGNAVIVLDEFNRVEPWLHNTLYPILDHSRRTNIHGEEIVCGKNLIFVATVNQGYAFVGTFMLDAALTNRMDAVLNVRPLSAAVETKLLQKRTKISKDNAEWVVKVMNALRKLVNEGKISVDASTRSSLKVAEFIEAGILDRMEAVECVILASCPQEEAKAAVDAINSIK